jgi:hypothetical protein
MPSETTTNLSAKRRSFPGWVYAATIFVLAVSGFAQMPISKRYYLADIPGLGWLAQYYVTHYIHYLGSVVLLALVGWLVSDYLFSGRKTVRLTPWGMFRSAVLALLVANGAFLVVRNFGGFFFNPALIVTMDILHIGLVMVLLASSAYCLVRKKKWTSRV